MKKNPLTFFSKNAIYNFSVKMASPSFSPQTLTTVCKAIKSCDKDYGYRRPFCFSPFWLCLCRVFNPGKCLEEIPHWPSRHGKCQIVSRQSIAWTKFSNMTANSSKKFFKQNHGKKSEFCHVLH